MIYVVLMVMGLIPGLNTAFGLAPIHGNDIWLHLLLAVVAGAVGFLVHDRERSVTTEAC